NEVAHILLGELAILLMVGIPLGWAIGLGLANLVITALQTELYRVPLIITGRTLALAANVVVASALLSGFITWLRLRKLDLVAVLKTREYPTILQESCFGNRHKRIVTMYFLARYFFAGGCRLFLYSAPRACLGRSRHRSAWPVVSGHPRGRQNPGKKPIPDFRAGHRIPAPGGNECG